MEKLYNFVAKQVKNPKDDFLGYDGKPVTIQMTAQAAKAYWHRISQSKNKPTQSIFVPADDSFHFDEQGNIVEKAANAEPTAKLKKVTEPTV